MGRTPRFLTHQPPTEGLNHCRAKACCCFSTLSIELPLGLLLKESWGKLELKKAESECVGGQNSADSTAGIIGSAEEEAEKEEGEGQGGRGRSRQEKQTQMSSKMMAYMCFPHD